MRHQYAWQFSESASKSAPTEVVVERRAGHVREIREGDHIEIGDDGDGDPIVGGGVPTPTKSKK